MKKIFICFLILLLIAYPAYATEVSLNKWVLNVTLHEDGLVEEIIQAEIGNPGPLPLDGISFVVPASKVTMIYDFDHTSSFTGEVVEQQTVPGGVKIIINFNKSVEPGAKWNGRIGFTAENWAVKEGSNYSIDIPVEAPQAIVSGKDTKMSVQAEADIRSQVFLPKSVEVTNVTPKPFRILFQYGRMVPTWSADKLHIGDKISIKGSFSDALNKIVEVDGKLRELSVRIEDSKVQGKNVSEAEMHISKARDYNNQALEAFWKKEDTSVALDAAKDELKETENNLSGEVEPKEPNKTPEPADSKKTPGLGVPALVFIVLIAFLINRKK